MRTKLRENEKKILEVRKHWLVLIKPCISFVFFLAVTAILYSLESEIRMVWPVFLIISLVFGLYFIYEIFEMKVDVWIVTSLRVIHEHGVFSDNTKESSLDKIHNVSSQQSFIGRIFSYGTVQIQTAAEMGATTYNSVSSPKVLRDTITRCQDEYRQIQITEEAQKLAHAIKSDQKPGTDTKECPYCAEIIKAKAKVCRFCGRELK